jgi:uncharacterized MnhB-related membrane protein
MARTTNIRQENHMPEKYNLVIRMLIISGIFLLVYFGKLTAEVASGFIGIIVAYAFGKGKK